MKEITTVKIPTPAIEDNGMVRMGTFTPPFPPLRVTQPKEVHGDAAQRGVRTK